LIVVVPALQRHLSELDEVLQPLRQRATELLKQVDESYNIYLVEEGEIEPLSGDEWRSPESADEHRI
jgi:hypothetical protein